MKRIMLVSMILAFSVGIVHTQNNLKKIEGIKFSDVNITDEFWKPKIEKIATATLSACIYQTEVKTPRIRNFEKVARNKGEKHEGIYYDDSDVYKALEAMAYSLKTHPDKELERKADEWIDKIAAAQLPDGYLNTYYTLKGLDKRWTDMEKHEDYCAGHLIEAAVAYYNTTGKRKLLDVATRLANHIDSTFRLQNRHWVSGHQEIELALIKLYRVTNNDRYLKLAAWYLDQRGHGYGKGTIWDEWKDPAYCQDKVPIREQKEITGHAVRAMYLYTGAADVSANNNDEGYMNAMKAVWEDVVYRNMYIIGGIGSSGNNEGFSQDYDLPNEEAYCETCASVGMVFWNQRMNWLTGESKYIDILERSLYNGALDGLSLSGDRFFYGNPLASVGNNSRREWFGTACCPSNIARLVASVGDYIYAKSDNGIWVNLFIGSNTNVAFGKTNVMVNMETSYPWSGNVKVLLTSKKKVKFTLYVRIPGWAGDQAVPGDLYTFLDKNTSPVVINLNGKSIEYKVVDGYAVIDREWEKENKIEIKLPMNVRRIIARPEVKQDIDRVALQVGPIVYCIEGTDNNKHAMNVVLPENTIFVVKDFSVLSEKVKALQAEVPVITVAGDGLSLFTEKKQITAIPYYTWCNREKNEMQVWIPQRINNIKLNN
jgi:DUF1680 family protein